MQPTDCSRFYDCNAAVCPLDPRWRSAVHLSGEKVCYYLLNSGKVGSEERFKDDPVMAAVRVALPLVCEKRPVIARTVERAARTGFRKPNLPRLKASADETGEGPDPEGDGGASRKDLPSPARPESSASTVPAAAPPGDAAATRGGDHAKGR
jgi:hypothetical protein